MQFLNIRDYKTGGTIKALNFGGPKCYKVSGKYVWAPEGGTSLAISENSITLEPLGLVINNPNIWTVVSHQNIGTADWRITVKNLATNEEKSGVYPFNLQGNVYELECQPGTWVMASCGGYKIESSWSGQQSYELYRLKGTNELLYSIINIGGGPYLWYRIIWQSPPDNGVTSQYTTGLARIDMWYQNAKWVIDVKATVSNPGITVDKTLQDLKTAANLVDGQLYIIDHRYYGEYVWYTKYYYDSFDHENTSSYVSATGLPIGSITKQPKKVSFRLPVVVSSTVAEVIFDKLNLNK